ncbi:MAG: FixH family protein [Mediterranea sp.]|jgi:hypothetical protein|nr:FixH family protein [Mediterranea sp.]
MKKKCITLSWVLFFALAIASCDKDEPLVVEDPTAGLLPAPVEGLTTENGYTFHFYSADGKLTRGYTEIFIALTGADGKWVDDFTVSRFHPLMDMGEHKHATPVGKVEKVEGKALYKTWFGFLMYTGQMDGKWVLDFNYTISQTEGKITGAVPQVDPYPTENAKWIQSFKIGDETYYLTIVSPLALKEGSNTLKAYINKVEDSLLPYETVDGGYKIEIDPRMPDMDNHSSPNNKALEWDAQEGIYKGTLNLSMTGHWRINLKVLSTTGDLIGGTDVEGAGNSTLYWDIHI